MSQRFQILQELGERIERTALAPESQSRSGSHVPLSLGSLPDWLRAHPARLWTLLGAGGGVVIGAAALAAVLLVSGTATTSASWAAVPRAARPSALATALKKCYKITATSNALGRPVLSESRGKTTAAVYVADGTVSLCRYNDSLGDVDTESMGPERSAPSADLLSAPYVDEGGSGYGHLPRKLAEELKRQHGHLTRAENIAMDYNREDGGYGFWALGRAGSDVSRVKFRFANKKTVVATVENGWYFAWWPWTTDPASATVTTMNGTFTSPMRNAFPNHGLGSKPAAACQPSSAGCVFAKTSVTERTPAPATRTTSPIGSAIATCNKFSLSSDVVPGNVFAIRPVMTDSHASFAAVFSISSDKLYGCLTGGNAGNTDDFFMEELRSFGPVGDIPNPGKITTPYVGQSGEGSGRPTGRGRPGGLGLRPGLSQARMQASFEKRNGAGYGPYAIGQTGSGVIGVEIKFANGKSVSAVIEDNWYFAWWPWVSRPTSITVRTQTATATSPLKASENVNRTSFAPGCGPGAANCVFAK